jgi:adenylate kinase family enzyme
MLRLMDVRRAIFEHLDGYRRELVLRAARFLLRQAQGMASSVSLEKSWPVECRDLWVGDGLQGITEPVIAQRLAALAAARDKQRSLAVPLERLRVRLRLTEPVVALLASCTVAALDPSVLRLWAALRPTTVSAGLPLGTWIELFGDGSARFDLLAAVHPGAPLRRLALLHIDGEAVSPLTAPVRVPWRVVGALAAVEASDPELHSLAVSFHEPLTPDDVVISDADVKAIVAVHQKLNGRGHVLILGNPGSGRLTRARLLSSGRGCVVMDPAAPTDEESTRIVALGLREALLLDALPVVRTDAILEARQEARRTPLPGRLVDQLKSFEGDVCLVGHQNRLPALHTALPGAHELHVPRMLLRDQQVLWDRTLKDARVRFGRDLSGRVVAAYDMAPRDIVQIGTHLERGGGTVDMPEVRDSVRASVAQNLVGLAHRYSTHLGWNDIVLPDSVLDRLKELTAHARHQTDVFEDWGFRKKLGYGRSLAALFYGPPGTGKTMVAAIIANDLGRDIYRVDLSSVVDKYVGETEKNLQRIFDEATRAHAMLLFDEADSLFAKRTSVESANDRYANLAVNFLLQAIEQYDGVCVLTTNLEEAIDEGFRRRLRFRVEFPKPTEDERVALWKSMLPPEAKVAPDIAWGEIASHFPEMTGGNIKNVVIRAAFLAVAEGGVIDAVRLRRAALMEYEELGYLVPKQEKGRIVSASRRSPE